MTLIHVTLRDESVRSLDVADGDPLMFALRDHDLGVEAICSGAVSCATCHVLVTGGPTEALPAPDAMESALLDDLIHQTKKSRLSCQIEVTPALEGLEVTIAPHEA